MSTATSAVQRRQARLSRLPATGHAVGLAILIALSSFLFFFELGRPNLLLWDESRLAVNALEMAQSGNYLVTTYDGAPDTWNSKPPLAIWLMSLSVSLLGASEVSVRLPAALRGFFTMLLLSSGHGPSDLESWRTFQGPRAR